MQQYTFVSIKNEINFSFGWIDQHSRYIFRECSSGSVFRRTLWKISKKLIFRRRIFLSIRTNLFERRISLCTESSSSSKRCDKRVKIARNTLEENRLGHPRHFSPPSPSFFPSLSFRRKIGRKRIKFGFLGLWIWPGEHASSHRFEPLKP